MTNIEAAMILMGVVLCFATAAFGIPWLVLNWERLCIWAIKALQTDRFCPEAIEIARDIETHPEHWTYREGSLAYGFRNISSGQTLTHNEMTMVVEFHRQLGAISIRVVMRNDLWVPNKLERQIIWEMVHWRMQGYGRTQVAQMFRNHRQQIGSSRTAVITDVAQ